MIKSINLINFQSHANTRIDFDPGVNCIIGSSRSGKTAILRGLNWCRYNKPNGINLISYWNKDKKKIKELSAVTISFEDREVTRGRDSNWNGYELEENHTFEALGSDVPEEIEAIWNMNEINIQKQFDSPYLLGESSAEVARILNKTIKLDKIDKVLAEAEDRRRKLNKTITSERDSMESLRKQYSGMNWIDDAEKLIIAAERRHDRIDSKQNEKDELFELLSDIKDLKKGLVEIDFEPVLQKIDEYRNLREKLANNSSEVESLDYLLDQIDMYYQMIEDVPEGLEKLIQLMNEAEELDKLIDSKDSHFSSIGHLRDLIILQKENIDFEEENLIKLNSMMPETCVLCGAKIKKEVSNEKA